MTGRRIPALAVLLALALLAGCQTTRYESQDTATGPGQAAPLDRQVRFHLSPAYWADPPDCALILPATGAGDPAVREAVDAALRRHLSDRLDRVLGRQAVARRARALALDPTNDADLKVLARQTRCGAVARADVTLYEDTYALVWSQRQLALRVTLHRVADGRLLWAAGHVTGRGDGGLPLSLLSAPVSAFEAARFHGDAEMVHSLADDAVRRMVASLPGGF